MGGDGGVIASNRRYMRGAGTADHTADYNNSKELASNNPQEVMTTCALTRTKFKPNSKIVACRFGKLYFKEAAIQELLENKQRRKKQKKSGNKNDELSASPLAHVRKLSELYDVRFQYPPTEDKQSADKTSTTVSPICPMTSKTLNGTVAAVLLVPGNADQPNVISETSWKQLTETEWEQEYGPINHRIRLAPPPQIVEELMEAYEQELIAEAKEKEASSSSNGDNKKKKKKHHHDDSQQKGNKKAKHSNNSSNSNSNNDSVGNNNGAVSSSSSSKIQSNKVLSSLFCKTETMKNLSAKEHKDNLFAR